jgi:hypothetical protein
MTKVLYISGWGRSGTTLLDSLLGQVEGFVSTGELHQIWQRGLVQGRSCGCGLPVVECPFWRQAFEGGFGGIGAVDAEAAMRAQREVHTRHARRVLSALRSHALLEKYEYAQYMSKLYSGITSVDPANTRVIVDSSKYPTDAIVASGLPGVEVFVLHVVRDPRAVAFSWRRIKNAPDKRADGGRLRRVGMVRSTVVWQFYNWVIMRYVRRAVGSSHFAQLTYEQLAARPEETLEQVVRLLGETPAYRPEFQGNEVEVARSHTASGNPNRFDAGRRTIRLDSEWETKMPAWRKLAVSLLAFPMITRLRYPWKV